MQLRTVIVTAICLVFVTSAYAGGRKVLSVGDPAPGLDVESWVKGEQMTIEKDQVYLIEFWATWCKPCRESIPLLSTLQEELGYVGLNVIAVSSEEKDVVTMFVRRNKDAMKYTVAVDRRKATERAWVTAAKKSGVPVVFLVGKKGKIQYIGHPKDEKLLNILPNVLDGRYDAKLHKKASRALGQIAVSRRMKNWRMCFQLMDDVLELDSHVFARLTLRKFEIMLMDMDDQEQAYEYARELMVEYAHDPPILASLAMKITTDPDITEDKRDLEVAMEAAELAAAGTAEDIPLRYSTQALVHYHAGRVEEAIALQRKAWFVARPIVKPSFKRVLDDYQKTLARQTARSGSNHEPGAQAELRSKGG